MEWYGTKFNENEPIFKQSLEEFNIVLSKYVDWDLFDVLRSNDEQKINQLDVVQPVLVAISIALAKLWESKGFLPNAVIGHSMGEVAAAYIANIISLEDAVKIICNRSRLMLQVSGKGLMLATDLTIDEANKRIESIKDKVSIAVVNCQHSLVLSGDADEIKNILESLEHEGRFARLIKVDVASHSMQMDGIDEALKQTLLDLKPQNSQIEFYSSVLKNKIDGENLDAAYWKQNLRQTVEFKDTIAQILKNGKCIFVEMSPHPTLLNSIHNNIIDSSSQSICVGSLNREKNETESFFKNIARFTNIILI
jgi:Polyketide synthase modules and related proteins